MNISISKQEIFNEVEKLSSYEGSVIPDRFDNLWANEEKGEVLNSFWIEGYTAVVQLLKRYLKNATVGYTISSYDKDEVVSINAEMPSRYNSLLDGSVTTDAKMIVACTILYRWLDLNHVDTSAKYNNEVSFYSESLKGSILFRKDPNNATVTAKNDNMIIQGEDEYIPTAKKDEVPLKQLWGTCGQ